VLVEPPNEVAERRLVALATRVAAGIAWPGMPEKLFV